MTSSVETENSTEEQVMVVPTELFKEVGYFQGFCYNAEPYLKTLLADGKTSYRPRSEMEEDPNFKQLIPYVLFRYRSDQGDLFFQYTRGSGQGEKRLHAKKSIGVGGHVSSFDADCNDAYIAGMHRELKEEVGYQPKDETKPDGKIIGLINDDSNEVGKVHLGIVHLIDVKHPEIVPQEKDLCDAGFWTVEKLIENRQQLESWSQIALDHITSADQQN